MTSLTIRRFTEPEARQAALWAYEPPFDLYNAGPDDVRMFMEISEGDFGYYAIVDAESNDELVGFCCFGPEARVKGQQAEEGTVDIGGGVRPDLVSQGLATAAFPAILSFAAETFGAERLRTAVAAFNERSTRLCRSAGFEVVRRFEGPGGREFIEVVRAAE